MKKNTKKRILKCVCSITALALCSVMLFSLAACSGGKKVPITQTKISSLKAQKNNTADKSLHMWDSQNLKSVASSGLVELLFDETDFTVCVKDTTYSKVWSTLPYEENAVASAANAQIIKGNKIYNLNTQDNSVAFNRATYEINGNTVKVTYILTPDKKTADKKSFSQNDIAFKLTIEYTLTDGSLNVAAKAENLAKDSDARLTRLSLLPYFGAQQKPSSGDFIFVPDGSGAIIKTDTEDKDFKKPLNFAVYGNDLSVTAKQKDLSAIIPAYGMKQGSSAFVILITKGDALSEIEADRVREGNDFFKVGSTFNLTPYGTQKNKKNETLSLLDGSYKKEVSLCIRFLNGSNANYTGMAAASREQLIREHVLSTKTVKEAEYLPLELNIIGAADKNLFKIGKFAPKHLKSYTDFEEAQDMVSRMKAKGINGLNLIYKGVLSGGLDQSKASGASLLRRLGSKNDLDELYEFMQAQNMGMFLDINLLSSSKSHSFSGSKAVGNIFDDKAVFVRDHELSGAEKLPGKYQNRLLNPNYLKKEIVDILGKGYLKSFTGLCIGDVGSLLYSDFAHGVDRQSAAKIISDEITSLTAGRTLMSHKGNFYMIKDVEFISQLPSQTQVKQNDAYISVPFVQLILHGIVEYSCEPINYSEDPKSAMLSCIEYGACPTYELTYKNVSGKKDDIYFYENWITPAAEFYQRANEALFDVRSSRMTDHTEVSPNVFCTEYNSGEKIYVNYTDDDVVVSGLTIPANDFLRIN